jgi:uncharacterized 2Fe-2S/4Fe-4S cluster protein (DUF4445 family)
VRIDGGRLVCSVIGRGLPRGLCGSGLVDAVAAGLDLKRVEPSGRLNPGPALSLSPPVLVTQADIRELQLAKGAIAAGLRILVQQWGARMDDLSQVYLAGAFGNYINRSSARRIGLLDFPPEKLMAAGNTALLGARMALFESAPANLSFPEVRRRIAYVPLNEDGQFQSLYAEAMKFPNAGQ